MESLKNFTVICILLLGFTNSSYQLNCNFNATDNSCGGVKLKQYLPAEKVFVAATSLTQCTAEGIYADPENVSNFYVCISDEVQGFLKYKFSCGPNKYFDETNKECLESLDIPTSSLVTSELTTITSLSSEFSTTPAPPTSTPTTEAPSITPAPTTSTTTTEAPYTTPAPTSTTTTEAPYTTPAPTSTTTTEDPSTTTTEAPFTCTSSGFFPFPRNCKFYYKCSKVYVCRLFQCTSSFRMSTYICPGHTYYNENIRRCSYEITPVCLAQILQNYPVAPMTAATESVKSFYCSKEEKLPFPSDCTKYLQCTRKGTAFLKSCPTGFYFDETTNSCSWTMTPKCHRQFFEKYKGFD